MHALNSLMVDVRAIKIISHQRAVASIIVRSLALERVSIFYIIFGVCFVWFYFKILLLIENVV